MFQDIKMSFRMGLTVSGPVFYILEVDVNIDVPFKVFDDNSLLPTKSRNLCVFIN